MLLGRDIFNVLGMLTSEKQKLNLSFPDFHLNITGKDG